MDTEPNHDSANKIVDTAKFLMLFIVALFAIFPYSEATNGALLFSASIFFGFLSFCQGFNIVYTFLKQSINYKTPIVGQKVLRMLLFQFFFVAISLVLFAIALIKKIF